MMKQIEIKDLNCLVSASDVQYSPDGRYLAFVVTEADQKENGYRRNLWLKKEGNQARQITFQGKDGGFLWQDEETLLFPTVRAKEDEPQKPEEKTCFYRLKVTGGEAEKAFEVKKSVSFFRQVKPGLYCLGVREDRNALPAAADEQQRSDEADYHVIDEVPLWGNGRGFVSGIRTALYLFREEDGSLKRLSPAYMDVAEIDVRGQQVLCLGKEWKDLITETDSVILFDLEKGDSRVLLEQGRLKVSHAMFVGEEILLTGTDMKPYGGEQYHDFYRFVPDEGSWERICESGRLLGANIMTDCCYGGGESIVSDGSKVFAVGQYTYRDSIFCLDCSLPGDRQTGIQTASLQEIFPWNGMISCISSRGGRLAFAGMEANGCSEVYELENGRAVRVTALNDRFLAEHFVAKAKHIPFVNEAGITIDGWVLEPEGFNPDEGGKTYPGVLEIHGGPRCTYGEIFFHEMQVWASRGWFVFFCNPRGSEGYGEEFADLRGKYGTVDYEDLMAFTDHVLALYPQIDRKRLGAAGGSYGGFMCNWIEGHTDRFAAIASQRSVSNWVSDFGCSEIGVTFDPNEMQATPWTRPEAMWEASPLKYACNAKTPILFIHSMCDYNCTLDQGIQMFTAVKYFGVPARMCLFEGENHSLSRSGKPRHRMRRLQEMTDWFETYLAGNPAAKDS